MSIRADERGFAARLAARARPLQRLDGWMAAHPAHPRVAPFAVYVLLLWPVEMLRAAGSSAFPVAYAAQCALVAGMMLRWRALTPELNLRFHPVAVPAGLLGAAAWIGLGLAMSEGLPGVFGGHGGDPFAALPGPLAAAALGLRLVGMALVVSLFEELLFRSAVLRAFRTWRSAGIALLHVAEDLPLVGPLVLRTELSQRLRHELRPLADSFDETPLGALTAANLTISIVLWCLLSHLPRDWPGTVACGAIYAGGVWHTNRRGRASGLGPAVWAHAVTNACLWGYTLATGDWRFL